MPPDRNSSRDAFDIKKLDLQALDTSDGLGAALRLIRTACYRGDPGIAGMVAALNSHTYLFEYLISALEEDVYGKLLKWIVAGFPTPTTPNLTDAISMHLLRSFSSSLISVEYPSTANELPNLRESRRAVELSFDVLRILEENADRIQTRGNISPVNRKRGKSVTKNRFFDPLPFDSMGIVVPTTTAEVNAVYAQVLSQLQGTLEYYFLVLRNPLYFETFRSSYTKAARPSETNQPQNQSVPLIQPMKTSLYFDDIENFGEWAILLSARAHKDLRDINRDDGTIFEVAVKKIQQLSQGQFSRGNQKRLTAPTMKVPIFEARVTGDKRIIYQIDCIPDLRSSCADGSQDECQVVRIFGIFTHAEIKRKRFWDILSQQLQQRGQDYIDRCTFRNKPLNLDDDIILPAVFPPSTEWVRDVEGSSSLGKVSEEDMKEIHSMLVLDKFVMLSKALLNSILADKEVAHIFSVSAQEQEIIEHPLSCYVIGRSGTGKTTTMLFKMLSIQCTWERHRDMRQKPHQVFVTQSPVLAKEVKKYFMKLMSSIEVTTNSPKEPHATGVDAELGPEAIGEGVGLVVPEDNEEWKFKKFSGLSDKHFPLFITYDQLCGMLENDFGLSNHGDELTPMSPVVPGKTRQRLGSGITSSSDYMQQSRNNFVSYGVFLSSYWDHLPQTLTRALDPVLVFGEFMGVIKGSEDTVGTKHRRLDRDSYKSLSARCQGTFSHKRDDIYDLFIAYDKRKREELDYDAADRTHRILEALRGDGLGGQKVDFLYVDEVQDNLLIDTLVLRMICVNQHGLFWAGDTAQTISVGSSFRFADLKAYQHRIEKRLSCESGVTPIEPRTFQLVANYRSHSGIVNCARSIIELIIRYWPHSIDALRPERATIEGFRPIFFSGHEDADLEKSFFANSQGEAVDLGADQCILVRNDVTKARLEERLQGSMIMTLYESKGLEFNDVILYNFFKDSTATSNQWRLVLNGVHSGDGLHDAPTFDETRHAAICVELKFMYVAITRARKNLWIVDSSESAEPMKVHWGSKDQIEIWPSNAEMPHVAVTSTPEEWSKTGTKMFKNERYAQAKVAFLRAGQDREANLCDAFALREKARLMSTTAGVARTQAFLEVANTFFAYAQKAPPERDGERRVCYTAAAGCYSEARELKKAGDSYLMVERYKEAASHYKEGGHVDQMMEVITQHEGAFDSDLRERFVTFARMHYFKVPNIKAALALFPSKEKALEFLDDWDLDEARTKVLAELGRVLEAAEIHAKNGDMLKAVETLTASATRGVEYMRRKIEYLLAGLRQAFAFGTPSSSASHAASKLLVLADQLDKTAMTEQEVHELAMFQAIKSTDHKTLRTLADTFLGTNDIAALLCLDHAFSSTLSLRNLPLSEIQESHTLFFDYIRLLNKLLRDESLTKGSNRQRLFGFQVLGENRYLVPKRTILYKNLIDRPGSDGPSVDGYRCGSGELRRGTAEIMRSRIRDRTKAQDRACREVHGFSPCLRMLIQKECNLQKGQGPCAFQHVRPEQLTVDWYRSRLRLILLQFRILDSANCYELHVGSYWLWILYTAFHPPFQRPSFLATLDIANIPGASKSLVALRKWIRHVCYDLSDNSSGQEDRARQSFLVACMLAFDLDSEDARRYVHGTSMYESTLWPRFPPGEEGHSIVQDFVTFLRARAHNSLTLGSSFLQGVLHRKLRVDLNVLSDLVERLTAMFIMAHGVDSQGNAPHDAALPRSWFINFIHQGMDLRKDTSTMTTFASTLIEFVQKIDMQVQRYSTPAAATEEQFTSDSDRVTKLTGPLYIARICMCLCLVGYNARDEELKKKILAGIHSLHKGDGQLKLQVYQRYTDAKDWDCLMRALAESLKWSPPDEMILLLRDTASGQPEGLSEHVRPVTYHSLYRVPKQLLSNAPNVMRTIITRALQQQPRVGPTTGVKSDHDRQEQWALVNTPQEKVVDDKGEEAEASDGDHEQEVDEIQDDAADAMQEVDRHRLEQERAVAARKIQVIYRRYLKRKNVVRKGIDETQAHFWHLLRKRSTEMEWSKGSQYYLLFRVPLADVLVCLDLIGAFFESKKKDASKRMKEAHNKELDELMEARSEYSKLLRQTIALQKKLLPSSEFHEKRSVSDLQHAVAEVKAMVDSLDDIPESAGIRNRIRKRWDRGSKWVFEKQGGRAKGKKAEKPKLVLDREDLLWL